MSKTSSIRHYKNHSINSSSTPTLPGKRYGNIGKDEDEDKELPPFSFVYIATENTD